MEIPDTRLPETAQVPTLSQVDRAAKIRRFNWLYVYTPVIAGAVLILGLTVALLIIVLQPVSAEQRETISATADAFIILTTIPTLIVCGILPALFLITTFQFKRRGTAPISQTQRLFWRLDLALRQVQSTIASIAERIGRPFIQFQALGAFLRVFIRKLLNLIT